MRQVNPHCVANSWNCFDVNCGSPSDQKIPGTVVWLINSLIAAIRWLAVMSLPIGTSAMRHRQYIIYCEIKKFIS